MRGHHPISVWLGLWVLALAFGWIEATVVVYLREIAEPGGGGLRQALPPVPIDSRLLAVEVAREAWTLVLLGAGGWLAGSRWAERIGAFLLLFGVWDLAYYGVLKLLLDWPESLATWDVLFLIPRPWVAPVWAPALVALIFVVAGTHLLRTAGGPRRYRPIDAAILIGAALVVVASFLADSGAVGDGRPPSRFPLWLFGGGVLVGTSWFVRVETRPKSGVSRRPGPRKEETVETEEAARQYAEATKRFDNLTREAKVIGDRLSSLAQGLASNPERIVIGTPSQAVEGIAPDRVLSAEPLPSMEHLAALITAIRDTARRIDDLRERLILMGRADLVQARPRFFE